MLKGSRQGRIALLSSERPRAFFLLPASPPPHDDLYQQHTSISNAVTGRPAAGSDAEVVPVRLGTQQLAGDLPCSTGCQLSD